MFRFHVIDKKFLMFFRFKRNKNIVNVTSVKYRFKLRRTFVKLNFFIMTKKVSGKESPSET